MAHTGWQPQVTPELMQQKARLLQDIRAFFHEQQVLEVDTPVLSPATVTDPHIDSFKTTLANTTLYLQTSPEFAMKRLLAAGYPSVYQIGKAFRLEEISPLHNPEFTLLEWYRLSMDYEQLMHDVESLFLRLATLFNVETCCYRLSYREAFHNALGIDALMISVSELRLYCDENNIDTPVGMSDSEIDEWLDWLMVSQVAPSFPKDRFTVLYDYPASQSALARIRRDHPPVAERFEVFWGDIELANGFHELTDADEQHQRFLADNDKRRANGQQPVAIDENLLAALESGLPDCAGVAVGLDRLLMVLLGKTSIRDVLAFPYD